MGTLFSVVLILGVVVFFVSQIYGFIVDIKSRKKKKEEKRKNNDVESSTTSEIND